MAEKLMRDDWQDLILGQLNGGLRLDVRPDLIDESQSPDLENVWFDKAEVRSDTGYKKFMGVVRGDPRLAYQFFLTTGSSFLCLVTDDTFYIEQNDEWQYVGDGTDDTIAVNAVATDTVITTTGSATFTAADHIGITLNDGTQDQTTVVSHVGTTLTIADQLTGDADAANVIVKAADLNGSADVQVSVVTMPFVNWMVFTNGVDNVQHFDGLTVEDLPNMPSSGNTQCRVVALFTNHLLLLHTTEGGTAHPQRVRRSDAGDPTEWVTGTAGYSELLDSEDWIVAAAPLGPYLIIYKERTIVRVEYVGSDDLLFNFDTMISGEGALSQDSVADLGDFHMFLGNANVYAYRGGFDIEPMGDSIYYKMFGNSGELNPTYKARSFLIYLEELDEVWIVYPAGSDEIPKNLLRYKQATGAWAPRILTHSLTGFGFYQRNTSLTWQEAAGTWAAYTYPWNSQRSLANSPTTLLCGDETNQVFEYDYIVTDDDGTTINYEISTKDLIQPGFNIRVDWLDISMVGGSTEIAYSVDEGANWTPYGTVAGVAEPTVYRLYGDDGQFITEKVRFKVSSSAVGFVLDWIKVRIKLESQW